MSLISAYHYISLESDHDASNEAVITTTRFRLLALDPGEAADDVSCTLAPYCLYAAPDYEAISYVWGDPTDTCDLICSGQRLTITKSLYSALCGFRLASQKRTLWADAICINQGDLKERNAQVSIMDKIYSQARQVLIWLGVETDYDSEALDIVSRLETLLPPAPPTLGEIAKLSTPHFYLRMVNSIPLSSWKQIACLLSKPWFQRVWIIQEVLMARSALLFNGPKSIAWPLFATVAERIRAYDLQSVFSGFKDAVVALNNIGLIGPKDSEMRRPFIRLLCATRNFKSSDPRDKLYALLGISDSTAVSCAGVDYTIPVSNLFVQFTKQELVSGSLAHLSATDYSDDIARVALPTWVPDWSRPISAVIPEVIGLYFNAGGTSSPRVDFSPSHDLLIIEGKRLFCVNRLGTMRYIEVGDAIISTSAKYDAASQKLTTTQFVLKWLDDCHKVAFGDDFLFTQETFNSGSYRQFCKALYSELHDDATGEVDHLSRLYLLLKKRLELQQNASPLVDEDESEILRTVIQYEQKTAQFTSSKYFCSDDFGRLGWVPRRAQVGDLFCVFLGAKVPHLLRPVADGRYELIGPCHLQGCMNGEVIGLESFAVEKFILT